MNHHKTPSVTVLDNRGLTVRSIAYCRHPDTPGVTRERITRHQYDARGFLVQSADPRLHDAGLANFTYLTDLTGNILRTVSADAGTTVALSDAAGRPFMALSNIATEHKDGREQQDRSQMLTRTWQYEDADLPGRPLNVTEQVSGDAARITERFAYAGNSDAEKALNLAGRCVALTGIPLSVTRCLLRDADNPDTVADWQGDGASAWNDMLTGRKMANASQQGCSLPSATVPFPADSAAYTNYTRTYTYDDAGNLTQVRHSAPATNNSYTTNITVSDRSNRGGGG